jgi:hypothetical protein
MPVLNDDADPSPSSDEQEEAREGTLEGGFQSPRQWRTDPRWPLRKKPGTEEES